MLAFSCCDLQLVEVYVVILKPLLLLLLRLSDTPQLLLRIDLHPGQGMTEGRTMAKAALEEWARLVWSRDGPEKDTRVAGVAPLHDKGLQHLQHCNNIHYLDRNQGSSI